MACFVDCTRAGLRALVREERCSPLGIAFRKDFVFRKGGGRAFHVRGDERPSVEQMPEALRYRATRFWPTPRRCCSPEPPGGSPAAALGPVVGSCRAQ